MLVLKSTNLAARFGLEMALLGALTVWTWRFAMGPTRLAAATATPLAIAAIWVLVVHADHVPKAVRAGSEFACLALSRRRVPPRPPLDSRCARRRRPLQRGSPRRLEAVTTISNTQRHRRCRSEKPQRDHVESVWVRPPSSRCFSVRLSDPQARVTSSPNPAGAKPSELPVSGED